MYDYITYWYVYDKCYNQKCRVSALERETVSDNVLEQPTSTLRLQHKFHLINGRNNLLILQPSQQWDYGLDMW